MHPSWIAITEDGHTVYVRSTKIDVVIALPDGTTEFWAGSQSWVSPSSAADVIDTIDAAVKAGAEYDASNTAGLPLPLPPTPSPSPAA